ncbi:hypothetical protein E2C01_093188 [Portunus trituberculatus]|uniref:Uncharacterized protein n=1 Tax=Portunus trituberculatus TaxID=210409 RepID=A0A5B7JID7_PORTR|nr:hypothetical protein [Portunus trituberculatus]
MIFFIMLLSVSFNAILMIVSVLSVEANNPFMSLSGVRVSCIVTLRSFSSLFIIISSPILYSHIGLLLLLPIYVCVKEEKRA